MRCVVGPNAHKGQNWFLGQVAVLMAKSVVQEESLLERASQCDALSTEFAASSRSEDLLRIELQQQRHAFSAELNTALVDLHATEEQSASHRVEAKRMWGWWFGIAVRTPGQPTPPQRFWK